MAKGKEPKKTEIPHVVGGRNVFEDLDLPDARGLQAKAELVIQIARVIKRRRLTQGQAAKLLGIDQPKVSALLSGRLSGFSLERLFRFLSLLERDIEIVVRPTGHHRPGRIAVSAQPRRR